MRLPQFLTSIYASALLMSVAHAQAPEIVCGDGVLIGCKDTGQIAKPDGSQFNNLIGTIVSTTITIFAVIAVLFVIWGGIRLILSLGNDEKMRSAVRTILYALLGLFLSILSLTIVSIVSNIHLF